MCSKKKVSRLKCRFQFSSDLHLDNDHMRRPQNVHGWQFNFLFHSVQR